MDELLKKIADSAEGIEVPEGLEPENIVNTAEKYERIRRRRRGKKIAGLSAAAAVLVLCIFSVSWIGGTGGMTARSGLDMSGEQAAAGETAPELAEAEDGGAVKQGVVGAGEAGEIKPGAAGAGEAGEIKPGAVGAEDAENGSRNNAITEMQETVQPRQNAGTLYTLAESYEEVETMLRQSVSCYGYYETADGAMPEAATGAEGGAVSGSARTDTVLNETMNLMESMESNKAEQQDLYSTQYSTTNLQTAGVDEADIVKTDGDYIYIAGDRRIAVVDIRDGELKEICSVKVNAPVQEMYIDGDRMMVIVQQEHTVMDNVMGNIATDNAANSITGNVTDKVKDNVSESEDQGRVSAAYTSDMVYLNTSSVTALYTYDIADRGNPVLLGEITQDGTYHTSRKVDDVVYLFTDYYAPYREYVSESGLIPMVNNRKIAADCIYLPERGSQSLLISSMNITEPEKIVDNIMILHNNVDIYVTARSIYLYNTVYQGNGERTQIAKFSLQKGRMNAVAAANAEGVVRDTFAINEEGDILRLLTTTYDYGADGESNNLYLFDGKLVLTGFLENIAPGEEIYAARYLKDTAYFITYRNMDPLFAADISDPSRPVLLGEVEISGFSDYLHFWGENSLLGIGYETDARDGSRKGVKLTMFDISDPVNLKVQGVKVIRNSTYCPSLNNYKYILAEPGRNLIGILVAENGSNLSYHYCLFGWEKDTFESLAVMTLPNTINPGEFRGLYSGTVFYLTNKEVITSYDMENNYQKLKEITLGE